MMNTFPNFHGNTAVVQTLKKMIAGERIPQTILLSGPEGIGKATLARRFAAALLHDSTQDRARRFKPSRQPRKYGRAR